MVDIRDVRLDPDSLYSLVSLDALIEQVIGGASHGYYTYSRHKTQRDHGRSWTGAYFEARYKRGDVQRQVWGFFGLIFDEPSKAKLAISLDRDWDPRFVDLLCDSGELPRDDRLCLRDGELRAMAADEDLQEFLTLPLQDRRLHQSSADSARHVAA